MKSWFVAHTHAQSERKAAFNLQQQGFSVYLPVHLKLRRHARRRDWIAAPLFPRYLFVAFDPENEQWRSVRSTIGVACLICNGDHPIAVPQRVVDEIRAREDANGYVVVNRLLGLRSGQRVRVLTGAFADQVGIFQAETDRDRVHVLLELLGRLVKVEVPLDAIVSPA